MHTPIGLKSGKKNTIRKTGVHSWEDTIKKEQRTNSVDSSVWEAVMSGLERVKLKNIHC
jgi:hypothetical protein